MADSLPVLMLFGVGILALGLILVGIFAAGRSRQAADQPDGFPPPPSALVPAEVPAPSRSSSDAVQIGLDPDGSAWVEIKGRRYPRLSEVGNEQLTRRAWAALGALQRFVGVATSDTPSSLADELRVGHMPEDGALVVEFRGQRYQRLSDIRDGETGRALLALIGELSAFAQGMAIRSGEQLGQVEEEFLKQLARPMSEPAPVRLPSLVNSTRRQVPKPEPMPVGIAGQIDAILQDHLLRHPILHGRSIQVITARDGSLAVEIDRAAVPWPDGVADPVVREVVQQAIRAWEKL